MRFLVIAFLWVFLPSHTDAQAVKNGHADLSGHLFVQDGPADLSGTWEFYYHQLLTPADFGAPRKFVSIRVPGSWHKQGDYPVIGFATYRIQVTLPENQSGLSLYFPIINSSAKIWINGALIAETGKVSADPILSSAKLMGTMVPLPDKAQVLDIVVQVANNAYTIGGIGASPFIERSSSLLVTVSKANGIENFFAGSLLAMFLYQLILFFLFDRGKPYLWLSLICLGVGLRALITHGGSFLLPNLYPSLSWEFWKKMEFGSVYAMVALFALYIYHLFPEHASRKLMFFFVGLSAVLCLAVLTTNQPTYGLLLDVCHGALLLAFAYAIYSVGTAWKAGNKDARIILFGVLASFPFILTEILKNSLLFSFDIQFMYLVELGVLVFLLFQVYLLANHYAKSYRNLETSFLGLEKTVTERTAELTAANAVKNRLLSVMSHDVRSPLNSLRDVLHLYNHGNINQKEFEVFVRQVESDLVRTSGLVENILFWTARQLKGVPAKIDRFDVRALVDENIQLFLTVATNKNIQIASDVPLNFLVKADRNILNFVLRNLMANAIKFSPEGGSVQIQAALEGRFLSVLVKDLGIGMDPETIQSLLTPKAHASMMGTDNEKGTGIGLALCHEYILKAGGQLTVESAKGKGSNFSFLLPVE